MCTNVGRVIYMAVGNLLINSMGESVNTMALCIGRPPLTMGHCIGDLTLDILANVRLKRRQCNQN